MSNPYVIGGVAVVFVVFAASMFGAFEIALPASLQTRLSQVGGKGYLGALAMGLVSGIIAAPCTGPVLGSVLLWVATQQEAALGGSLLFLYSLGMGLPFFLIGTFAVSLPKSGPWMDAVKSFFGVLMLVAALYIAKDAFPVLREHVPQGPVAVAGAVVAVLLGTALGAMHLSFHGTWLRRVRKGAGVLFVVGGAHMGVILTTTAPTIKNTFTPDQWVAKEAAFLGEACLAGRPVVLDFGAEWCIACKDLEKKTYPDPKVAAELTRFEFVKIDETKPSPSGDQLDEKYGVVGLPYVVFLDGDGQVLKDKSFYGYKPPAEFLALLRDVKSSGAGAEGARQTLCARQGTSQPN
jgi:thiol:disulfide interchange protein DsbD